MAKLSSIGLTSLNDISMEQYGGYQAIPAGVYNASVADVDLRNTKSRTGQYLSVQLDILDEPFDRRKVWANLNIINPSEKAQAIGRSQLKAMALSAGITDLQDTDDLVGALVKVVLGIDKEDSSRNVVKGFEYEEFAAAPTATAATPAVQAPPVAASASAMPWKK